MKTIRKLNGFLLIVAIVCAMVFTVIDFKEEKYSKYEEKIQMPCA